MRSALVAACLVLAACGPGVDDLPTVDEAGVDTSAAVMEAAATPQPEVGGEGFLAGLFGRGPRVPEASAEAEREPTQASPLTTDAEEEATTADAARTGGFFGLFRGQSQAPEVQQASATAMARAPRVSRAPAEAEVGDIAPGTRLAYGQIARVCGLRRSALGAEVGRYPERGRGYRLYDSTPGSTAPRTHYLTGFADGCPRQFTAALALFGAAGMHEQIRYRKSSDLVPYTATDAAYERIKSRICRVRRGAPCPENRLPRMEASTVFVSVYERFGSGPRWADILIHDGEVVAKDFKGR